MRIGRREEKIGGRRGGGDRGEKVEGEGREESGKQRKKKGKGSGRGRKSIIKVSVWVL